MRETVQVLLSSYNGERYIREQLDSILAQEGVGVSILVRDDGSTDETRNILENYENSHKNITVLYGKNVGVIRSFFALIEEAGSGASYTAFSDQDDVWLPDKLMRAARLLKAEEEKRQGMRQKAAGGTGERPLAYCSARQLVDADLRPLRQAVRYPNIRTGFGNALVENMCTGCTCVVNRDLLRLIKGRTPEFTVMHDFWIYLVGTCFGAVLYDEESRILYRQHGGNELGAASSLLENYRRRMRNYRKHRGQLGRQAAEFLKVYGDEMPIEKKELAEELVRAGTDREARKKLLAERRVFRQRKSDNFILKLFLLFGLL